MKKVIFLGSTYSSLTIGKVYDVVKYNQGYKNQLGYSTASIVINNDFNDLLTYYIFTTFGDAIFKNITSEYRNDIINDILN